MSGRLCLAALLGCLLFAPLVRAQEAPQYEGFIGGSYAREDITDYKFINGVGWHGSVAGNANTWVGAVFDFSGQYSFPNIQLLAAPPVTFNANTSAYSYLFGPRFTLRHFDRFQPFGEALFGLETFKFTGTLKLSGVTIAQLTTPVSATSFAMGLGGGVDMPLKSWLAIRLIEVDYIPTRFREIEVDPTTFQPSFSGPKRTQQNVRASVGIVFRFGGIY